MNSTPHLLANALQELDHARLWWELLLIGASLGLGWLLARTINKRFPDVGVGAWKLTGFARVLSPAIAILLLLVARAAFKAWLPTSILNLALAALIALALIRLVAYLLHSGFAPGSVVQLMERIATWLVVLALLLHVTGLHLDVLNALDEVSLTLGKQRISLLTVFEGVLSVSMTLVITLSIGRLLERRLMKAEGLNLNHRIVLAKAMRALLVFFGVLIALPLAGIDITFLSVFGGALGVGLGFGLQKVASNYISGFIILLDRSIRIGDMVTIGDHFGEITEINNRYTVLKEQDGTEAIIPNETLITSTVINHSFTNREVRIHVPVSVAYGTDVERALAILIEAALANPRVLRDRAPSAYLREFGDNGLNLELVIWIRDPEEGQISLRSALNLEILKRFQAGGIEIPYPRRDIRILESPPPTAN